MSASGSPSVSRPVGFLGAIRREFAGPLLAFAVFVLLLAGWWIDPAHLPLHDTLHGYEVFQTAYSQFALTGALPEWLPYSNYGMPTYLRHLIMIPPFYLPVMWLGRLTGISNAWALYRVLLLADAGIYVLGTYLLLRLFVKRAAAALLAAACLWTVILDYNFYLSLRLVTLLPLALFFLVRWARASHPLHWLCAATAAAMGCWGVPHYFVPLYLFVYAVSAVALAAVYRPSFRWPRTAGFWFLFAATAAFSLTIAYLYWTSIQGLEFFSTGRDPKTLQVTLHTFLTYGGGGILKTLEILIAAPFRSPDAFFFAGSVAVVLAVYALLFRRSRELWGLIALFGIFLVFCWGRFSPVARVAFYFPAMPYFRHVGLVYAIPKVFLAVIAAIGLEAAVAHLSAAEAPIVARARTYLSGIAALAGATGALFAGVYFYRHSYRYAASVLQFPTKWPAVALAVVALLGYAAIFPIARRAPAPRVFGWLAAVTLLQCGLYQGVCTYALFYRPWRLPGALRNTAPTPFLETRTPQPLDAARADWLQALDRRDRIVYFYPELDSFIAFDSCVPNTRVDYVTSAMAEFARRELGPGKTPLDLAGRYAERPEDPLFVAMGCGVAKMQWVAGEGRQIPKAAPWPDACVREILCLANPDGTERRSIPWPDGRVPAAPDLRSQGIELKEFSFNRVSVALAPGTPGWLIYADSYHPDWHASIDGHNTPVWRANFGFKAVPLAPGPHRIAFLFGAPWASAAYWAAGLAGTAGLLLLLALAARHVVRSSLFS